MSDAAPAQDRLAALREGGKAAVARALARLETAPDAPETLALLDAANAAPRGHVVGLTGPPGVGKSSLANCLIRLWREAGLTVAVLAVDPSSRRTRGALLGDRTRIETDPEDAGIFVRSMAARDRLGGLAEITWPAAVLMRALFDRVLIETVGVGQSETEIAELADTVTLCVQPASGDALQFMKSGVMETPHILAVTKADLGEVARRALADLKGAMSLAPPRPDGAAPEALACSSGDMQGARPLLTALEARIGAIAPEDLAARRAASLRAWAALAIRERFGREGLAAAAPALEASAFDAAPFATAGRVAEALFATLKGFRGSDPALTRLP
jgi:LAO/AO transport system kinase